MSTQKNIEKPCSIVGAGRSTERQDGDGTKPKKEEEAAEDDEERRNRSRRRRRGKSRKRRKRGKRRKRRKRRKTGKWRKRMKRIKTTGGCSESKNPSRRSPARKSYYKDQ